MTIFDNYNREANSYISQFGLTGAHNGNADAFRHAYASAAMTQDFGPFIAGLTGSLWESKGFGLVPV